MSVGRANANTLRIRDDRIAAHHVRIERENSRYVLEVTAVDARTTLNGAQLQMGERRPLNDGDMIGLADLEFRFINDRSGVLSRLWVVAGVHRGKAFRIENAEVQIGRATDNDVQFPDRSVSRHHCRIRRRGEIWWIEDLGSTNGTIVHGTPLRTPQQLQHGDEVVAGFSKFLFQEGDRPLVNLRLESLPPCN
ncbi:MAG: FHA domain-containing protein [Gemmatimonadota bacterium]|nr:MAG: FHA domain-containing protein [Gemmatimonadota bacterium]